jgi:hypothetical protein
VKNSAKPMPIERDRVEEAGDDEHLHLQRPGSVRLARGAFQELATEQTEADGGPRAPRPKIRPTPRAVKLWNLSNCRDVFHFSSNRICTNYVNDQ